MATILATIIKRQMILRDINQYMNTTQIRKIGILCRILYGVGRYD